MIRHSLGQKLLLVQKNTMQDRSSSTSILESQPQCVHHTGSAMHTSPDASETFLLCLSACRLCLSGSPLVSRSHPSLHTRKVCGEDVLMQLGTINMLGTMLVLKATYYA